MQATIAVLTQLDFVFVSGSRWKPPNEQIYVLLARPDGRADFL